MNYEINIVVDHNIKTHILHINSMLQLLRALLGLPVYMVTTVVVLCGKTSLVKVYLTTTYGMKFLRIGYQKG